MTNKQVLTGLNSNLASAKIVCLVYEAYGVAPHGSTARFNYNPPDGKVLDILACWVWTRRVTVAGAAGRVLANVKENQVPNRRFASIQHTSNDLGFQKAVFLGRGNKRIRGVSALTGETSDLSTGGTVDYNIGLIGLEYDSK